MTSDQPIGPAVDTTPAARPGPVVLEGAHAIRSRSSIPASTARRYGGRSATTIGSGPTWATGRLPMKPRLPLARRARRGQRPLCLCRDRPAAGRGDRHRDADGDPPGDAGHRDGQHRLFAAASSARRPRPRRSTSPRLRLRHARLPALRVEVQRPQCAVAAGGASPGVYLRGDFPAAYDHQGPEPRHGMVRHARRGMAETEGYLRTVARPFEFRRGRPAARRPSRHSAARADRACGAGLRRRPPHMPRPTSSSRSRTSCSDTSTSSRPSMAAIS